MGLIDWLRSFKYYGIGPYYADQQQSFLAGASFDYKTEAGLVYDNSVVAACINFVYRKLGESKLQIERYNSTDRMWEVYEDDSIANGLLEAFNRPNIYYDHTVLWYGIILSLSISGNAYLHKRRDPRGNVVGFDYISHNFMRPRSDHDNADGTKLITHYQYTPPLGYPINVPLEDVLHIKWGIDPKNPAVGMSMFSSVYREIVADNELSTSTSALARNAGKPGSILSPKPGLGIKAPTADQRNIITRLWNSYIRDKRGMAFFSPLPIDITANAFSPEQMQIGQQRNDLAARISAPYGLDVMVLGLPSENKTYSNFGEALDAAIENCFIPIQTNIARQISYNLLDVTRSSYRFSWDNSNVRGLQEDVNNLHERVREDWKSNMIDRYTMKQQLGMKADAKDKDVYYTDTLPKANNNDTMLVTNGAKKNGTTVSKSLLDLS